MQTGLTNQNVLVTGGGGFIGTNLTLALVAMGAHVSVIELSSADCSHLPAGVNVLRADINDKSAIAGMFRDQAYVFHLAARADLDGRAVEDYATNFRGTENIIEELKAEAALRRFVLYSTQLVVGIFNETRFIDETEPFRTKTLYGTSKIMAETVTNDLCREYGVPYTIIRPTSVFGPYGREPYARFFKAVRDGRYFHIGKADNLISMVYVKNLVEQTLLLATSDEADGGVFFGNDFHPYTMRQFADETARYYEKKVPTVPAAFAYLVAYALALPKVIGIPVPLYPFRLRNIMANYCFDISSSLRLGYLPRYDLRSGIVETLDWYEANEWNTGR